MAVNLIPHKMEDVVEMLKVMQNGDDFYVGESFAFTAELRVRVDDVVAAMENSKQDVITKEGKKEATVQASKDAQKEARVLVSRAKSYLVSCYIPLYSYL